MGVQIGQVEIPGYTVLAPLAGMTDRTFRVLCRRHGASLAVTEMVSARGLVEGSAGTGRYLDFGRDEHPISVQVFGSDPSVMAEAARIVSERGPQLIDVNCGCPVRKIVSQNAGAALLKDPARLGRIVEAIVRAVDLPVTVKIRSGWAEAGEAVDVARAAEAGGASAIAVHGRTRAAGFSGEANWDAIGHVRRAVSIPVIGNGDVRTPEAARRMVDQTGCHLVMIGRWAVGNPWIFRRTEAYLATGERIPEPTPSERIELAVVHLGMAMREKGVHTGVRQMRRHLAAYVKGMPGAAALRRRLMTETEPPRVEALLRDFLARQEEVLTEEVGR